ncbi:methylcobalamin:coenzyme M methyltransferase [Limihaloglobus sulfuriphilus]|uniref:Methylcobalamin:coenzyme M methyltransferase n=1 Tax=Limihaloglobus sulfuriphilus TaxID=1851148 RepID=A0A1Q2MB79_9BACT|nr:uroporphyrinogen decarboxylase family protein [Limihaloglobus sulfuriphilus]AQQ69919.1 methylcobalamin:coenzyme M methyltransferase [Limihaloglobus sulfuriphilus]
MAKMTPKERFLAAINGEKADRLPVTTHHVMQSFLNHQLDGASVPEFFDRFGLDPINWILPVKGDETAGTYKNDMDMIVSDNWRIETEDVSGQEYPTKRYNIITPKGTLTTVMQSNEHTSWVTEHLIKEKKDIDLIGEFCPSPLCDVAVVNKEANEYGEKGLLRSHIVCFDIFGQPGTWQDASCLYGIEKLMMATFDDPEWVHSFLEILNNRKAAYIKSMSGARYDILELGGGDASTTVISPDIFEKFVAPYDSRLVELAHEAGQRIVYHTCGGMMPILESIAAMKVDAMETFTPPAMGGDTDLEEARRRLGSKMCMIGGFDQFHYFTGCSPEETRAEVRRCFEAAGYNGAYIICPSDHFFEADLANLEAFADEAKKCVY